MLTRDLLIDAAEVCAHAGFGSFTLVQRHVRVGFATASQLLLALEDIGMLSSPQSGGYRPAQRQGVDRDALAAEIDRAIATGRIAI